MGPTKATAAERQHMAMVAAIGCLCCRALGYYDSPAAIHHPVEGGKRKGHMYALPLCHRHHQDHPNEPSRHPNKAAFERVWGTERELVGKVYRLLDIDPPADVLAWIGEHRE